MHQRTVRSRHRHQHNTGRGKKFIAPNFFLLSVQRSQRKKDLLVVMFSNFLIWKHPPLFSPQKDDDFPFSPNDVYLQPPFSDKTCVWYIIANHKGNIPKDYQEGKKK